MKILLINPSINPDKFGRFHLLMEPMPCIGVAYIAAVLEKDGHSVEIIDNYVMKYQESEIVEYINSSRPDVVGISVLTPSVNFSLRLAKEIKINNKKIILISGNVHPTLFPEEFLKEGCFDIVVRGEGEATMSELMFVISQKKDLGSVKGISYFKEGKVFNNERRPVIENLDQLPMPAWHLLPYKEYGLFPFADIKKPILTIMATRGCPYNCKYCSLSYMDKAYRKRSPANIVDEMEILTEKFGIKQIGFVDPIFPLENDYAVAVLDEIIKRGINKQIIWIAETRADILNESLIKKMKEAGCRRLIFGLESGTQEVLNSIGKSISFEKVRSVIKLLKVNNMESIGLFMIGLPGENEDMIRQTFKYSRDIGIDFAKYAMTVPFPGSELYEIMKREKKIRTDNWDNYTTFNPIPENVPYVPDGMTAQQLIKLQKVGTMQFYLRPKMIYRIFVKIRTVKLNMILKGIYCLLP